MKLVTLTALLLAGAAEATALNGIVSLQSQNSVSETVKRLESEASKQGIKVVYRREHGARAPKSSERAEREKHLLLLEVADLEAKWLSESDTVGLDLPLKLYTFEDGEGKVWISYPDPSAIAARHKLPQTELSYRLSHLLSSLTLRAVRKP